jgi:hypothetical protein
VASMAKRLNFITLFLMVMMNFNLLKKCNKRYLQP